MAELDVVGRTFGSNTVAERTEEGDWKVTVTMIEKRLVKGGEWEERVISAFCVDRHFENAYPVSMNSVLEQFDDLLKKTGTDSMFESEPEGLEIVLGDKESL